MEQFQNLPHHRLQSILATRKLEWRSPKYSSAKLCGTQERIFDSILSIQLEKGKITYDTMKAELKELKLVCL
jgi:hypothetical protein